MKEAAPAADESATRGVFPPGAPPTSPSTVTDNTRDTHRAVDNDTYSAFVALASGVFAL